MGEQLALAPYRVQSVWLIAYVVAMAKTTFPHRTHLHFPACHAGGWWGHMAEFWPTGWSQAEGMPFLDTTTLPYKD